MLELFKFETVGMYKKMLLIDGKKEDGVITYLDKESWLKRNS